jgi:Co/Zn/Cd efflux system component
MHVLADALTSVLAIAALSGGLWLGHAWLDPAVALVGAVVIGRWSFGVLGGSARALVDATQDPALLARIRTAVESDGDTRIADLHVWQVGGSAWSAALAVVADVPRPAAEYRARLTDIAQLRHVTVEVHRCPGCGS